MKLVTAGQMRALDRLAIDSRNIPSLTLMERAGKGVADRVISQTTPTSTIGILVGKGNNGGDGLVAGRYLSESGRTVIYFITDDPHFASPDALANWKKLNHHAITAYYPLTAESVTLWMSQLAQCDYLIDAIYGTGLSKAIEEPLASLIPKMNARGKPLLAVDIPSGINADTGAIMGVAIRATHTATLALPKVAFAANSAIDYCGLIEVIDIGIPAEAVNSCSTLLNWVTADDISFINRARPLISHKGTFGHLLTIAGSIGKIGAGYLTAFSALKTGCGLSTLALPKGAYDKFDLAAAEIMVAPVADNHHGFFTTDSVLDVQKLAIDKAVVAIGPGIGTENETKAFVEKIISECTVPLIIDADAINCIAKDPMIVRQARAFTIITPHPGEMARLTGLSTETIQGNRLAIASEWAKRLGVILVLKGARTIIATPGGPLFVNSTGTPAMATAGMGDALTGMIAALVANAAFYKTDLVHAVVAAVYLHGMAGMIAAEKIGNVGMTATDLISQIPTAIVELKGVSCESKK